MLTCFRHEAEIASYDSGEFTWLSTWKESISRVHKIIGDGQTTLMQAMQNPKQFDPKFVQGMQKEAEGLLTVIKLVHSSVMHSTSFTDGGAATPIKDKRA